MVPPEFDPSQTNDEFVISALDYAEILVGSCFMQRVNKKAPNSKITIVGRNPNTIKELINGSIDITLGAAPRQIPENCHSSLILNGKLVCVVDKNHPLANETITLEKYLAYPHAILHSGFAKLPVDEALAKLGHKRVVAKESPNFVASVMSLRKTSMILSLPEIAVTSLLDVSGLVMHDLPFDVPPLKISMIWHKRNETNPSHRWFQTRINVGDVECWGFQKLSLQP